MVLGHRDTVAEHERLEHKWVAVRRGRGVAVHHGSPLLQERAALVGGTIVGALHHVGIADACGGVSTKRAVEVVAWRDVTGESRGDT